MEARYRGHGQFKKLEKAGEPKSDAPAERSKDRNGDGSLTLDDILLAAIERGLTMRDADEMTLGQIVDFCVAFNERQEQAASAAENQSKKKKKPTKRKATQADINAWFG